MNLHIAQIPKLIAQRRGTAVLGMTIIAMVWGGIFISYRESVKQEYHHAEKTNQNYAMLFEENVLRSIGEIDKAILYLRGSVKVGKETAEYPTIVKTTDVLSEIIVQVAIIDANGISRATNALPQPGRVIDISDREHFRVHLNSSEDQLFIGKPVVGRASGKWSVQFTRRLSNSDGGFAGIVVASMDPAHFTTFYDKIDLGSTTSVALVGSDGIVRSSGGGSPAGRLPPGMDLHGSERMRRIQSGSAATFHDARTSPEEASFVTARKVRGYPLWVTISTKMSDIDRAPWADLRKNALIAACLTLLILVALE